VTIARLWMKGSWYVEVRLFPKERALRWPGYETGEITCVCLGIGFAAMTIGHRRRFLAAAQKFTHHLAHHESDEALPTATLNPLSRMRKAS
jgi:hypothetical protein